MIVLFLATLALRHVAGEQHDYGVKRGTGQLTYPVIRMIRAGRANDLRPLRHTLAELLRKGFERHLIHAQRAQAVPGESQGYPSGIWRGRPHRFSRAYLVDQAR